MAHLQIGHFSFRTTRILSSFVNTLGTTEAATLFRRRAVDPEREADGVIKNNINLARLQRAKAEGAVTHADQSVYRQANRLHSPTNLPVLAFLHLQFQKGAAALPLQDADFLEAEKSV